MQVQTRRMMAAAGLALALAGAASAQSGALDQSRAYASEMLADAAGRTNSLAQGDGEFTAEVHGFIKFRYNLNQRDDDGLDSNDNDLTNGFTISTTRLVVTGKIVENWGYTVSFDFADSTSGGSSLKDAYGTYNAGNGWKWTFGQFKVPLYREENISDTLLLFANRSVNNSVFSQSRSQGVMAGYEADKFQFSAAFTDGLRTQNTDFTSMSEADWALTGRFNYKWAGEWKQARDFTGFQGGEYFGMAGVGAHFQDGGDTVGTSDTQQWHLTADAQMEGNGWNLYAAAMARNLDPDTGHDLLDYGFLIQGGIFVAPQWELIGGYDVILPDDDRATGDDEFSTIRVGVNYYVVPESHQVKVTVDLSYFLDTQSDSIAPASTATGLLPSGEDSQWNLRGQLQLVF